TSIKHIHKVLNLETIEERANNLFVKFLTNKSKIETIAKEIQEYNNCLKILMPNALKLRSII
ncbi:hypothetical protein BpHYR1_027452, partial [Brachionus plicatilis]